MFFIYTHAFSSTVYQFGLDSVSVLWVKEITLRAFVFMIYLWFKDGWLYFCILQITFQTCESFLYIKICNAGVREIEQ